MSYEMINTQEAIKLFRHLLQSNSQMRVLRLVGATKIGKSHLLTKVFPQIVHELYQARLAIIDLRNPAHTIPDFLDIASRQLGDQACNNYARASHHWTNRPKVEVKGLLAKFARISISAKDSIDDAFDRDRYLAEHFLNDLAKLDDKPLLLFFDSVDCSTKAIQTWLLDTFIPQVSTLPHVRVVIAGCDLPEASGSYTASCKSYRLKPVKKVKEYVTYCQMINATLPEDIIRILVSAARYTPGFFVELMHNLSVAEDDE
jgi:hypothetical protein